MKFKTSCKLEYVVIDVKKENSLYMPSVCLTGGIYNLLEFYF